VISVFNLQELHAAHDAVKRDAVGKE